MEVFERPEDRGTNDRETVVDVERQPLESGELIEEGAGPYTIESRVVDRKSFERLDTTLNP